MSRSRSVIKCSRKFGASESILARNWAPIKTKSDLNGYAMNPNKSWRLVLESVFSYELWCNLIDFELFWGVPHDGYFWELLNPRIIKGPIFEIHPCWLTGSIWEHQPHPGALPGKSRRRNCSLISEVPEVCGKAQPRELLKVRPPEALKRVIFIEPPQAAELWK